ncbi:hypothetical protein FRC17_008794 [Serendipita sp. 399]|nr:hypothetical protein FRC17_008794 [Serendipita sp. 399]
MYGVQDISSERIAKGDIEVNEYIVGITVACLNITAFFAALVSANVCDVMGRRAAIRIGSLLLFIAALMQTIAPNLAVLIVGRSIQGLGVGFLSMTVPIIQTEIAPGHARGVFVTIENLFLNAGFSLSTWVGYAFYSFMPSEMAWRGSYIVFTGISFVLLIGTIFLPETPRWLIKNGFHEEGLATLMDLQDASDSNDEGVCHTYKEIVAAIEFEEQQGGKSSWKEIFTQYTRRTVMAFTCQMFAQLNGINAILYFLPENLIRAGFDVPTSLLYTGACSTMLIAGILPTIYLVDSLGRRSILIIGGLGMAFCLAIVGGLQFHVDTLESTSPQLASSAKGIFACVCLYLAFFAFSWGPIPWLIPAEVFPLRARARGMALATGSNWFWDFVIAFATPPLSQSLRGGIYFIIVGFVCISILLVIFVYRETAGTTLEELSEVFGDVAFDNVTNVAVPDMKEARQSMHLSPRRRSTSATFGSPPLDVDMIASRSGVGMGALSKHGFKQEGGNAGWMMGRLGTMAGLEVIQEPVPESRRPSQITLMGESEEKVKKERG